MNILNSVSRAPKLLLIFGLLSVFLSACSKTEFPTDDIDASDPAAPVNPAADTLAPVISISAPADGFITTDDAIQVSGSATDNVGITSISVMLTGQPATEVFSSATGVTQANFDQSINLPEGSFTVTVLAEDAAGNSNSLNRTVTRQAVGAPAVNAQFSQAGSVTAGAATSFDANGSSGSGELTFDWDFGDGRSGGGEQIAHIFSQAGEFTVNLLVTDANGNTGNATQVIQIEEGPQPESNDGSLQISLIDSADAPVPGANIRIVGSGANATSNAEGIANLNNLAVGVPLTVAVEADAFASQFASAQIPADTNATDLELRLLSRAPAQTLADVEQGGIVVGTEGVSVTLPANALVDATGNPVTGDVDIALTPLDVSDDTTLESFPGGFAAIDTTGAPGSLLSLGLAEFDLRQNGEPLNLAPGMMAELRIPIYVTELDDGTPIAAGQSIPLWSLDETTGDWVQEGTGTVVADPASPTGFAFDIEVSHFSWWNCDLFFENFETLIRVVLDDDAIEDDDIVLTDVTIKAFALLSENSPRVRAQSTISASGQSLLFPDVDIEICAVANDGTLASDIMIIQAGTQPTTVVLPVRPVQGANSQTIAVQIPVDTTNSIDNSSDSIQYTFDAIEDQIYNVTVAPLPENGLVGTVSIDLPDSAKITGDFDLIQPFLGASIAGANGEATVTVTSLKAEPGAFRLQITSESADEEPLTLDEPRTIQLTPENPTARLKVDTPTGTWVGYIARLLGSGSATMRSGPSVRPAQNSLAVRTRAAYDIRQSVQDTSFIEITLNSDDPVEVELRADNVPTISVDNDIEGNLTVGDTRFWRLPPTPAVEFASLGLMASSQLFRGEIRRDSDSNGILTGNLTRNPFAYDVNADYLVRISAGSVDGDFRFAVANILAPTPIAFINGQAQFDESLSVMGDVDFYQFDVPSGTGLDASLENRGESPVGEGADLVLFRTETPNDLDSRNLTQVNPRYSVDNAPESSPLREQLGIQLNREESETYLIAVHNQFNGGSTGDYRLNLRVALPGAAHVVDDDGADCEDATTPSLLAANFAVTAGGSITVCNGRYEHLITLEPQVNNLSLVSRGVPILANLDGELVFNRNNAVDTLVLDGFQIEAGTSPALTVGPESTLRNLNINSAGSNNVAINVIGDNVTLDNISFTGFDRIVRAFSQSGFRFENSTASGGQARIEIDRCEDCQIIGNEIDSAGASVPVVAIAGEDVTVRNNRFSATDNTDVIASFEARQRSTSGLLTVADNLFESEGPGVSLEVNVDPAQLVFERNHSTQSLTNARFGLEMRTTTSGGSVLVRNNTFDGVVGASSFGTSAVRITQRLDSGNFELVNNSFRSGNQGLSSDGALVNVQSNDDGDLDLFIYNNIFQGTDDAENVRVGIQIDEDVSVDSDSNLFHNVNQNYGGGGTRTGGSDLTGDPQYIDDSLAVDPASPAVDSGRGPMAGSPTIPADDIDGIARPLGEGFDRGAHEQ